MATLKDIQRKIGAIKKTQQITRAMNMVAAAKLRGAQEATERFKPYAAKFREVLGSLAAGVEPELHPFFQARESVSKVAVILVTFDRGMCGAFNTNLITMARKFAAQKKADGVETAYIAAGKKGRDYLKKRPVEMVKAYLDVLNKPDYELAREIANYAADLFLSGEVDEVYLVYSQFINVAKLVPTTAKLLPLSPEDLLEKDPEEESLPGGTDPGEYLVEPSPGEVLIELLPKNISVQVLSALLETSSSAYAAQMAAMDNATSNCKELIQNLTLAYNKARQAAITAELMDIVGGAEALNQ